ncbi:hybrid signal transduction histidine kinase M, partial [Tanacetum coccineum]
MAVEDTPPPPPTVNMEKPFGVTNIKSHVPLVLDLDQLNYDAWCELFTSHCHNFGVHGLLDGSHTSTSETASEWKKLDSLDKARSMELHEELRSLEIRSLSIAEYFKKIKVISDLLSNIDAPVSEKNLLMYAANGLTDKYEHVASIIRHTKTPLTLLEARSMLLLEELCLNRKQGRDSTHDTSSSSTVLLASGSGSNKGRSNKELCRNFQRGFCRFADRCRFVHARGSSNGKSQQWGSQSRPSAAAQPTGPAPYPYQTYGTVDQPTTLPRAFNATILRYADNNDDSGWYMDTGATSHLLADA